jgi:hypothetical protein
MTRRDNLTDHLPWNKEPQRTVDWESKISKIIWFLGLLVLFILPIPGSTVNPNQQLEQIRSFSRRYEFDYVSWINAVIFRKMKQASLNVSQYLSPQDEREIVLDYLELSKQASQIETDLANTLSDPNLDHRDQRAEKIRGDLEEVTSGRERIAPFVEQILQSQINTVLTDLNMSLGGQLFPPVLFRSEPNSFALIVSPRDEIKQVANLMLIRGLTLDQIIQLEMSIEDNLDLSALVVGIGGVGLYPSMVIESSNLDWLIHVIGHEWTHNYLTIRPLGANYYASPELKTINETIADLSADDIQLRVFELYYQELVPEEPTAAPKPSDKPEFVEPPPVPPPFNFRAEMHQTRLEVDRLLAAGEIEAAEDYMESRRLFFWENGYQIRKLNQAYFAFHGSYAADPGGAASEEGVDLGAQLRALRESAPSYQAFMRQVAWRWKLEQFQELFDSQQ